MRVPALYMLGLAIIVTLTAAMAAQSPTSNLITVSGTVSTASGAGIENAQGIVKLAKCDCSACDTPECKCCPTQLTVDIQRDGKFIFSVPHGTYTFEVRSGGLTAESQLDLNEGTRKKLDVTLH
jgi:uncharacterized membrane protein